MRAMAATRSVDLSITITAAVPRPLFSSLSAVEVHQRGLGLLRRDHGHRGAAGDHRLQVAPAAAHAAAVLLQELLQRGCSWPLRRCRDFSTWPEIDITLVPVLFGRPKPANQPAPRRRIVPTTAIDSTLFTVVGHP